MLDNTAFGVDTSASHIRITTSSPSDSAAELCGLQQIAPEHSHRPEILTKHGGGKCVQSGSEVLSLVVIE